MKLPDCAAVGKGESSLIRKDKVFLYIYEKLLYSVRKD